LNTAIIGAGIAGLAAAVRLAVRGHRVTVFEANDYPGGKLTAFRRDGYRFDAGPSLFTMPQYVDELFELAGEDPRRHFHYEAVPVACHYFWDDGTELPAWSNARRFGEECERRFGFPASAVEAFLARSARKYELAGRIFLERSLHRAATWFSRPAMQASLRLPFYDLFSSMHDVHAQHFAREPKLIQLFDRYATYNGSDPYRAPGMLTIIPHFEYNVGVFYPEGGMHVITTSIFALAQRLGVQFRFGTPVEEIVTRGGRVSGLVAGGHGYPFERVVSNMDVFYTYKKLLPGERHPERVLRQPKSTSALIFYWGIDRAFPELGLHNIFFSNDYRAEFAALERGDVDDDPTVYVNITSKLTPDDAPAGGENWFVMVNVPPDGGQDWPALIARTREQVLRNLGRRLGAPDLAARITTEDVLEPRLIELRTSSHRGALYGYSSNNRLAAFLRHANFSRRIGGLYFVGGSVHPGGGIPLCLLSARIAAEAMPD
jgi:phytoene desaturase